MLSIINIKIRTYVYVSYYVCVCISVVCSKTRCLFSGAKTRCICILNSFVIRSVFKYFNISGLAEERMKEMDIDHSGEVDENEFAYAFVHWAGWEEDE